MSTEIWLLLLILSKHWILKNVFTQLVWYGAPSRLDQPLVLEGRGWPLWGQQLSPPGQLGCTLSWISRSDVEGWCLPLLWQFLSSCSAVLPKCKLGGVLVLHPIRWEVVLFFQSDHDIYYLFFSQRNQDFYIISGGDDTSGSITRDVIRPKLISNRSKEIDGRIRETNQERTISKTNDGQTTVSNGGNVANNNNDQANVNTVNNMNTNIDTSNNNVNVLDVIMVGSLSPRLGHRPIGWNTS